ncbi:MAG: T9SS type A sorting domain-containing protein, partial [Bacteroidota bacterium]|nr:T9SS type A sorting domain-containing protein [Bacteroidota bacterium]
KFNSSNSSAPQGDSILNRYWLFGDSTVPLEGNRLDPSHTYQKAGKYTACLYIKTKSGCESKYCFDFTLTDSTASLPPANCKAYFTYSIKDSTVRFNSEGSRGSSETDSIISRTWYYSDSSTSVSLGGNIIAPSYQCSKPGTYPVYLVIKTKGGCESKYSSPVVIRPQITPTTCKAYFTYSIKDSTIYFNSEGSKAASETDSIISRTWYYTDSSHTVSLGGNVIAPFYSYTKPGSYPVYLVIKTKNGCESKYVANVIIQPKPTNSVCKAFFSYQVHNGQVSFTSSASHASSEQDSIQSRIWFFGDNTTPLQGNTINPVHHYSRTGRFTVYLYIKTKTGCESKYADTVSIDQINCEVKAVFSSERISLKKVQFNSSLSVAQTGDSIIQRIWKFGDNTVLSGNEIKPVKEFPYQGIYNTCLMVRTLYGCEAQTCNPVMVQDSSSNAQNTPNVVKILSINPNPVITRMVTTIYSSLANTEVEISIFDIYGTVKYTVKKQLLKGNNVFELPTESLYHGPYFLRVNSASGKDSKAFYKL